MWLLLVMVIVVLNGEMIIAYDVSDGSSILHLCRVDGVVIVLFHLFPWVYMSFQCKGHFSDGSADGGLADVFCISDII